MRDVRVTRHRTLCLCGCGQKTTVASRTINRLGWVKGQPKRFVLGHHAKSTASQRRGIPCAAATAARKAIAGERMRARVRDTFGELSEREMALVRFVNQASYMRGYQIGRYGFDRVNKAA